MTDHSSVETQEERRRELQLEYWLRFGERHAYRDAVWKILVAEFFQRLIPRDSTLLDLGCGWGEFINNIDASKKYGMDLNPDARERLAANVELLEQDCSDEWPLPDGSLDCVFTSNFFEHLHTKGDLRKTIVQIHRCLKPGGQLICIGPNIRCVPGAYWDFWDHYLPLTERSVTELLRLVGLRIERSTARFLPYTSSRRRAAPLLLLRIYLKVPLVWRFFGKQFLIVAAKEHS
jgi:SAM-dependent methyltransferase